MFQKNNQEIFAAIVFLATFLGVLVTTGLRLKTNSEINKEVIEISRNELNFGEGTEDIVIDTDRTIEPGEYSVKTFEVGDAKLTVNVSENPSWLVVRAKEQITIGVGGEVNLNGSGYRFFEDPESVTATQGLTYDYAGGGGSSASQGGSGSCSKSAEGTLTINSNLKNELGASGGSGDKIAGTGGRGGGYIKLIAPRIVIQGIVSVNGERGVKSGGGGGGGKIIILANQLEIDGKISANGGSGGNSQIQGAGGGSGGMVITSGGTFREKAIEVSGGLGGQALDIYTGCSGRNGSMGKIIRAKII